MTRMVLHKCENPKCWRYFPKAADSPRVCCDDVCDVQRVAVQAQQARTETRGQQQPQEAA